jgi:hypothetical protein
VLLENVNKSAAGDFLTFSACRHRWSALLSFI